MVAGNARIPFSLAELNYPARSQIKAVSQRHEIALPYTNRSVLSQQQNYMMWEIYKNDSNPIAVTVGLRYEPCWRTAQVRVVGTRYDTPAIGYSYRMSCLFTVYHESETMK